MEETFLPTTFLSKGNYKVILKDHLICKYIRKHNIKVEKNKVEATRGVVATNQK